MAIGIAIILALAFPQSPRVQNVPRFVMAVMGDPALRGLGTNAATHKADISHDNALLLSFREAGFNTMLGWPRSAAYGSGRGWFTPWGYTGKPDAGFAYRLQRMRDVGGLWSFFAHQWTLLKNGDTADAAKVGEALAYIHGADDSHKEWCPTGTRLCPFVENLRPGNLAQNLADLHLGWLLTPDEPLTPGVVRSLIDPVQTALAARQPGALSVFAMRTKWNFPMAEYSAYLDSYINLPTTRIVFHDYYLFETNAHNHKGYHTLGSAMPYYFTALDMQAKRIKARNERPGAARVDMWGYGGWVQHTILQPGIPDRELANLNDRMYGYCGYAQLLYGAKGLVYYGYDFEREERDGATVERHFKSPAQGSPFRDIATYDMLKTMNPRLARVGGVLLPSKWIRTIHGKSTDPCSNETGLEVLGAGTPFHFETSQSDAFRRDTGRGANSAWSMDSMAVGMFKSGGVDFLLFLNKSMYMKPDRTWTGFNQENKTLYSVSGWTIPRVFDETNGTWAKPEHVEFDQTKGPRGVTSFSLTTRPGFAKLVKLIDPLVTPMMLLD